MGNMHNMQFISLDAIFTLVSGMEIRCKGYKELCKPSRHSASVNLPTREELLGTKAKKRVGSRIRITLIVRVAEITGTFA